MGGGEVERILLSVSEAAHMLGISRAKMYMLRNVHEIESVSIGRARRIPQSAVSDYVRRLRADAG